MDDDQFAAVDQEAVATHERLDGDLLNLAVTRGIFVEIDAEQLAGVGLHDDE